jgi:thiamine-phosphate pyrophosphorylase
VSTVDVSLYAILDPDIGKHLPPDEFTRKIVEGGATCLQVRCKNSSTRTFMDFARLVMRGAEGSGVPVIIHDRVDIALALGAGGVHLGREDMPVADARRLAGNALIIGASVNELESARRALRAGTDYLGVGAVFPSTTKPDRAPISLDILRAIRVEIDLPIVAIGGIDATNAAVPIENGADGVAVISALRQCLDPKEAVLRLREAVDKAKKG